MFPCPLCTRALDVRQSKKAKPYVVCDGCGMQMFVRMESGIGKLTNLSQKANRQDLWTRLEEMQGRYRKTCPECRKEFWVTEGLISTSWVDGEFAGYKCPDADCDGIVKPEANK